MIESLSPSAKIKLHSHKWHQKSIANRTTNSETLPQPKLIDVQPMNRRIEQIAPYKLHLIGSEWGTSKHQTTTSNLYFPTNEGGKRLETENKSSILVPHSERKKFQQIQKGVRLLFVGHGQIDI